MANEKSVQYYLQLPYTFELIREDDITWFARVKELRGCMSEGDGPEEALAMIQDAMVGWLEVCLEDGVEIPEPLPEPDYSGKFNVRLPRSLHRDLALAAEREGVSLNQYIVAELARAVGRPAPQETQEKARPSRRKRSASSAAAGAHPSVLHERASPDAEYTTAE